MADNRNRVCAMRQSAVWLSSAHRHRHTIYLMPLHSIWYTHTHNLWVNKKARSEEFMNIHGSGERWLLGLLLLLLVTYANDWFICSFFIILFVVVVIVVSFSFFIYCPCIGYVYCLNVECHYRKFRLIFLMNGKCKCARVFHCNSQSAYNSDTVHCVHLPTNV